MKQKLISSLLILCIYASGCCSMPAVSAQKALYSFSKEEKIIKGGFVKKKSIEVKDFRGNEVYEEDIASLSEKVEQYFYNYPERPDSIKASLRELKVSAGLNKMEVELLLGRADKVMQLGPKDNAYGASTAWIYKKNKLRVFMIFIIPVFPVHEGYYLYFKDDSLAGIESHSLRQVVETSPAKGLFEREINTTK